ncbi:MAG: enhanced serine sensitivity protein SseB C-terminal domain-containing protein [Oscillospiraceae bacterium]|nr:enhanced serine sensitivity protein SseB C-terminal domain-containing protein [Oscillospiraceae bacterium]
MPEPMKPITNPVLVDAMAKFKLDLTNRENEKAFLEAAVDAKYLIPALVERASDEEPKPGEQVKMRVAFQIMTNQQGEQFMPAFTDEIEIRKNRKPGETFQIIVMNFMDLYQFVKNNEKIGGVVINPFGSALCLIRPQVIAIGDRGGDLSSVPTPPAPRPVHDHENQIPTGPSAEEIQAAQQDVIRQAMADLEAKKAAEADTEPETSPVTDDLIDALKACLKKQKAVKKAYIRPETESGERYLLVALEADENADLKAVGEAVSTGCADYSDLPLECVPASSIRAKALVAEEKPFYEKKRFGFF